METSIYIGVDSEAGGVPASVNYYCTSVYVDVWQCCAGEAGALQSFVWLLGLK